MSNERSSSRKRVKPGKFTILSSTEEYQLNLAIRESLSSTQQSQSKEQSPVPGRSESISNPSPNPPRELVLQEQSSFEVAANSVTASRPKTNSASRRRSKPPTLPPKQTKVIKEPVIKKLVNKEPVNKLKQNQKAETFGENPLLSNRKQRYLAVEQDSKSYIQPVNVSAKDFVTYITKSVLDPERYITMENDLGLSDPIVVSSRRQFGSHVQEGPQKRGPADSDFGSSQHSHKRQCKTGSSKEDDNHKSIFDIPHCPVYHPTVREFANPLDYIATIRVEAQKYGLCRIIPPPQWDPEWMLPKRVGFSFNTRVQKLHQLYARYGPNSHFIACLREHLTTQGIDLTTLPVLGGMEVDLYALSNVVKKKGGLQEVINKKKWSQIADEIKIPSCHQREHRLQGYYYKYLLSFNFLSHAEHITIEKVVLKKRKEMASKNKPSKATQESNSESDGEFDEESDSFGFGNGPNYTLESYEKMANTFKDLWFPKGAKSEDIEKKYWDLVESADRHVSVLYGSDIDTTKHGSGFSTDLNDPYSKFGWNLNVLPGLEGSILKHVSGISGISMPWMYVGMLFSSFCWHNEDNYLYSINYHHSGAPKMWYGVPGKDAPLLEASFRRHMPEEFRKRPLLMHDLVTMISPQRLKADKVPVCTTLQRAGEFVVTFPRAYHAGFSYGFNCGEAVNFAAADWIPFGHQAVKDYAKQRRPVSLNQEQLILNTAMLEKNTNTLQFTLPELINAREREREGREWLIARGMQSMTFNEFSKGQSREQGTLLSASRSKSESMNMRAIGRMASTPLTSKTHTVPLVCDICFHVCHLSMVVSGFVKGEKNIVRCLMCASRDHELGANSIGWEQGVADKDVLLVCRYRLDELDKLINKVKTRLQSA